MTSIMMYLDLFKSMMTSALTALQLVCLEQEDELGTLQNMTDQAVGTMVKMTENHNFIVKV